MCRCTLDAGRRVPEWKSAPFSPQSAGWGVKEKGCRLKLYFPAGPRRGASGHLSGQAGPGGRRGPQGARGAPKGGSPAATTRASRPRLAGSKSSSSSSSMATPRRRCHRLTPHFSNQNGSEQLRPGGQARRDPNAPSGGSPWRIKVLQSPHENARKGKRAPPLHYAPGKAYRAQGRRTWGVQTAPRAVDRAWILDGTPQWLPPP